MTCPTVLIADQDPSRVHSMVEALGGTGCRVFIATNLAEAILHMEKHRPDVVLFGSLVERGVLEEVWRRNVPCPIAIFLKDLRDSALLLATIRRAVGVAPPEQDYKEMSVDAEGPIIRGSHGKYPSHSASEILGESACMAEVRSRVVDAARSGLNVLITGETGTGKELVARAIHRFSVRGDRPLVVHNCATIPPDLFESQFFGHLRGAFTGATRDQAGLLAEASGSYLFLDELETLSLPHQAKLLRVLEDGEVRSLGSGKSRKVSVSFLAATNQDPRQMIAAGRLREDLYYRLAGFEITLPALREHPEDIAILIQHLLEENAGAVSSEAVEVLKAYAWPGNVRELQNVVRRAKALAQSAGGGVIKLHHLAICQTEKFVTSLEDPSVQGTLKELNTQAIMDALHAAGSKAEAARRLGIARTTLRRKLKDIEGQLRPGG